MKLKLFLLILSSILLSSYLLSKKIDYRDARNMNVCKTLKGEVLVYCVFVDTKSTLPWTEFDIQSTIDSLNTAVNWLNTKAREEKINLKVRSDYYIGQEFSTINKELPEGSVEKTITTPNLHTGIISLNKWADYIAKKAGLSFNLSEKDGIPEIKNPKNKERFVAYLRDEYKAESVALLFMVNNYYKTDISLHVNTMTTSDVEFAIVSYKYPSAIAHSVLNLFGAADLCSSPYRKSQKNIDFATKNFPNEIMQDPYAKSIKTMEMSNFTKYLIGWTDTLDEKYSDLLIDNRIKID
ncbi:MAG TPA: hypothetical protein DDX39_04340 [Bacteroidales bacterium]|nr:MAG: hypothetical protein A2W98_10660 [Bacteroidetes bacterium GWF2_33_38]OFY85456.1 MAG: hypothetical protein A2236_11575 [Bacteroidetes bacterium RIFOXYA2_FULL_33_7]HBF87852.1 hypothetical protein [Bacteroidales bacterium]